MNILFLTMLDPRMIEYGGQQRTHVLWNGLKSVGNVWTVIPVPRKEQEVSDDTNRVYKVCIEMRYSIGWFLQRLWARFLPSATVSWGVRLKLSPRHCALEQIKDVEFDVVVARFLGVAGRLKPWRLGPMYVDVDDTPVVDYARAHPSNHIRLWLLKLWQKRLCRKAVGLWVPDPEQGKELSEYNVTVLPNIPLIKNNGMPSCNVHVGQDWRQTLLFVGYLAHEPNYVAIDWFLKTYWHVLKQEFPSLRYRIAGGGLPDRFRRSWAQYADVELCGFVDDLGAFYASGCAFLAPMKIGSGTCIKVLESLACGIPVISTDQGFRGIPTGARTIKNGMLEFCDAGSLVAAIKLILAQESALAQDSRAYIAQNFSQDKVNSVLAKELLHSRPEDT